ncbi:histidinol-phosphatase [Actinomadura kijaniata]
MAAVAGYSDDLRLAHILADGADDITTRAFRALDAPALGRPDLSPAAETDRSVEEQVRGTLSRARPRDGVLGEEYGRTGYGQRVWIVDPIDCPENFVRGVPVWATMVALLEHDEVVVGVVSAPALNRRWWAARDGGAWTGRNINRAQRIRVSQVAKLADASLSSSDPAGWERHDRLDHFVNLTRSVWRTRSFGDFWSHMLVAEGAVDISAEPSASLWELAACQVVVEEAGGMFTDLSGVPSPDGGSVLCTNGRLHAEALRALGGGPLSLRV